MEITQYIAVLLFVFGTITQAIIILRTQISSFKIIGLLLFPLIVFLPFWNNISLSFRFYSFIFLSCASAAALLQKEQLSEISKEVILSVGFASVYAFLTLFPAKAFPQAFVIGTIVTLIGTIYSAVLYTKQLSLPQKKMLYSWFQAVLFLVTIVQIPHVPTYFNETARVSYGNMFIQGMMIFYIASTLFRIDSILETVSKNTLLDRFKDRPLSQKLFFIILLIEGISYIYNYYFQVIPHQLLLNIWLLFLPNLLLIQQKFHLQVRQNTH